MFCNEDEGLKRIIMVVITVLLTSVTWADENKVICNYHEWYAKLAKGYRFGFTHGEDSISFVPYSYQPDKEPLWVIEEKSDDSAFPYMYILSADSSFIPLCCKCYSKYSLRIEKKWNQFYQNYSFIVAEEENGFFCYRGEGEYDMYVGVPRKCDTFIFYTERMMKSDFVDFLEIQEIK